MRLVQVVIRCSEQAGIDPAIVGGIWLSSARTQMECMTRLGAFDVSNFNPTGKVIAFAGRVLGNEKTAKYINSAQTTVYNKSEVVYGINFPRIRFEKTRNDSGRGTPM